MGLSADGVGGASGVPAPVPADRVRPNRVEPGAGATLLWRFHSLGDVILATGVIRTLQARGELWVATEERFAPVLQGLVPGERLLARTDLARIAGRPFERVIDLQGTPGSRALARGLGRSQRSLQARSAARRWIVFWGDRRPRPRIPHAAARYAEAAGIPSGEPAHYLPSVVVTDEDRYAARTAAPRLFDTPPGRSVMLIAGASRRTKAYPREALAEVAGKLRARGHAVWWIEPPEAAGTPVAAGVVASETLRLGLPALKAVLAQAALVIASDSGPMHLAAALGRPVLGLFASTVPAFGFAPLGPGSALLEVRDLACRPCSVHGRDRCWLGHERCLRELSPERVAAEAAGRLAGEPLNAERKGG